MMSSSQIPSPSRSLEAKSASRRYKPRASRSVCSPARSNSSVKLSAIIQMEMDSFVLSPMPTRRSVLTDTTDIDVPTRKSWWRRLDENSKNIMEVISIKEPTEANNEIEEYIEIDVLSQEKKNYSLNLPDSSDGESIDSIVVPQRKLFTQKESQPQNKFGQLTHTRESLGKPHKSQVVDEVLDIGPKNLFNKGVQKRTKPIFPAALLHISENKTIDNKQIQPAAKREKVQVNSLFGNRPGTKRKNIFSEFVVSESEDEIPEIQLKVFGFQNKLKKKHTAIINERDYREPSPSNVTDIEMDDWRLLPSSTMVEHQLEDGLRTTLSKRARLNKLSESLESINTAPSKPKHSKTPLNSKNASKNTSKLKEMKTNDCIAPVTNKDEIHNVSDKQNNSKSKFAKRINTSNTSVSQNNNLSKHTFKNASKSNNSIKLKTDKKFTDCNNGTGHKSGEDKVVNKSNQNKSLKTASKIDQVLQSDDDDDFTLEYENDDESVEENNKTQISAENDIENHQQSFKGTENSITKNINASNQLQNSLKMKTDIHQMIKQRSEENNPENNICSEQIDPVTVSNKNDLDFKSQNTDISQNINKTCQENTDVLNDGRQQNQLYDFKNNDIETRNILSASQVTAENVEQRKDASVIKIHNVEGDNKDRISNKQPGIKSHVTQDNNGQKSHEKAMKNVELDNNNENARQQSIEVGEDKESYGEDIGNNKSNHVKNNIATQGEVANAEVNSSEENCNQEDIQDYVEDELKDGGDGDVQQRKMGVNQSIDNAEKTLKRNQSSSQEIHEGEWQEVQDQNKVEDNNENIVQDSEQNVSQGEDAEDDVQTDYEEEIETNDVYEFKRDKEEEIETDNEDEIEMDNEEEIETNSEDEGEMDDEEEIDTNNEDEIEMDNEEEFETDNENEVAMDNEDEIETANENEVVMYSEDEIEMDNEDEIEMDNEDEIEIDNEEVAATDDREDEGVNEEGDNEETLEEHSNVDTEQNESQDEIDSENVNNGKENQDCDDGNRDQPYLEYAAEHAEVNATHDTTGCHRKKEEQKDTSLEAVLHDKKNLITSFTAHGRNTSVRKSKSMIKNLNVNQSLAPRDSTGFSDGTRESSGQGSGWDSHRTTRLTLRKTFGKDFTPRKSLRALVMEKSAKRQTNFNDGNVEISKLPQANSTKLPEAETLYMDETEDLQATAESDHEVSRKTRQITLETYLQKIKNQNIERKRQLEVEIRNSLKAPKRDVLNPFKVPAVPKLRRTKVQTANTKPKTIKSSVIPLDMLPAEFLEDLKYKPPKRYQPPNAAWITKRLYTFLETKLEPKYDYKARVRAEKLVETLYQLTKESRRRRAAPAAAVRALQLEMARLGLVRTYFDFYEFFHKFMPREVRIKVVPDVFNEIPLPKHGVFSDILR